MVSMLVAGQHQNGFPRIQNRQCSHEIVKKIITSSGFNQKTTVVNIRYFHKQVPFSPLIEQQPIKTAHTYAQVFGIINIPMILFFMLYGRKSKFLIKHCLILFRFITWICKWHLQVFSTLS